MGSTSSLDAGETAATGPDSREGRYLLFRLGDQRLGLQVERVREIVTVKAVTAVPNPPPTYIGVINLRGKIIPVMDSRLAMGLEASPLGRRTCAIVVESASKERRDLTACVVDEVLEVVFVPASAISEPPQFSSEQVTRRVLGLAQVESEVTVLSSVEQMVSGEMPMEIPAGMLSEQDESA